MPDLRQALKDFVATSNSGKYTDEATLLSKFPELKSYDINSLKDFVATSNSGKYASEDELFSKFPEFGIGGEQSIVKKKANTVSPLAVGSSESPKKADVGFLGNLASSFDKGVLKNLIGEPAKGLGTLLEWGTGKITGGSGKGPISDALIKFGNSYNKIIDELTPQDEQFKNSLTDQFGQAFGQVLSLVATGGASKAASAAGKSVTALEMAELASQAAPKATNAVSGALRTIGAELSAPTSVSAGLAMGQSEFERAKEAGATDEQAFNVFLKNASVGSILETIPVMGFLKRFEKASAGGVSNYLKTKAVSGLVGGTEEMTTEIMQQLYSNQTAKDIYNTNQKLFEGVGESGGVGFGVGFLLNAMGANAKILRKEGKKAEADMVEKQMQEFEKQTKNGGPSSYKINGINLHPNVALPLIEKMDGADLAKANLEIVNDPELKVQVQNKIVTHSVKEQVRQGNPELNEPSLNAITDLELQLKKLEGNTTQTGKDKAAAIRQQIKDIQENQLQEEAKVETVEAELPELTAKRAERITELENILSQPRNENGNYVIDGKEVSGLDLKSELDNLKIEQDAIQKQTTNESVLRSEQPEMGLQQMGEGNTQPEVVATRTEEVAPTQQEEVIPDDLEQNGEPVESTLEAERRRSNGERIFAVTEQDEKPIEVTTLEMLRSYTPDQLIAYKPTTIQELSEREQERERDRLEEEIYKAKNDIPSSDNTEEAIAKYNDAKKALDSFDENIGKIKEDKRRKSNVETLVEDENDYSKQDNYEFTDLHKQDPRLAAVERIKDMIGFVKSGGLEQAYIGQGKTTEEAKIDSEKALKRSERDLADLQKDLQEKPIVSLKTQPITQTTQTQENVQQAAEPTGPIAGNRLFNKPLTQAKEVADRYFKRVFGKERPKFAGTRKLDEARAKRISDAYIAMKNDPNNPEVKRAYQALAKETLEQYKDFLDAGYTVEINNEEPYANSQEMIEDLRNNKRIKIFSTESGFGDNAITEKQRAENPLLADSGLKDINGQPLLINDVFRAIHDFYGHAELGNSFGAKGEENAWNVHARMFSPLARRAMTTETRGQNSYVNFSGVNERIEKLREEARRLREQGDEAGAQAIVNKIYEEGLFADQKIGLLPEEFSQFDEEDLGDVSMRPEGLQQRDVETPAVGEFEAKAKKIAESISNIELPDWFSATLPEGTKKAGLTAEQFKKMIADSVIEVGKLMDKGVEFAVAIKQAVKDLVNILGEDKRAKIEQTVTDYFNKGEGVSERELPGYDRLISEVDSIIEKSKKRGVSEDKMVDNVIKYVMGSKVYQNATDVQRERLVRDVRKMFGLKEKSAPLASRVIGAIKDVTKITMTEKALLKKQIKDLARGAKDAKTAWMKVSNELSKYIKEMSSLGTITDSQAKNVLRRFSKVNMFSQTSIDSFIDYMTKVFANAEYSAKLGQANSLKKDIAKLSKNKEKNANLRNLGQQFTKIDPSMVDDIDAYNQMAASIKEAIKGSTIKGQKVTFAETVNIENASEYITKTMEAQDEKIREQKAAEIQDLMGIDVSDFSYDDMMDLLDGNKPITKYNEGIIRSTINKMFDVYSTLINEAINTGKDPFTDEDIDFTEKQKELVKKFMDMDLSLLSPKEALQAVDALANFLQNKSTAKMESVVSDYTGNLNAKEIYQSGVKAFPLKKYNMQWLGKLLGEQLTNLNILFERMFKGFRVAGKVMDKMGFTKLVNGKAFSEKQSNNIVDRYVNDFYKREANGEAYNSEYNNTERGLAAFMMRNVMGTAKEMQAEFNRRKALIEQSIEVLSNGNDKEKAKAEIYKKAYDNILKDSNSIQDVKDNTDSTNLEGIEFWMKEWEDKYEQLSDVSENVYNKVLEKDLNYTPDRFSKLSSDTGVVELSNDDSAFHNNNGTIYKKETGVLMTAVKPNELPTNTKNGKPNRYIDLSFDNNNSNSMYDALIDINTAAPIRQIEGFLNSKYFEDIVPEPSNANILKDRIDLYVRNIRNKNPYSSDEMDKAIKRLNRIAAIGVGQALGGPTQVIKQVIPVAMNTIINAGGLDVLATFNEDKDNFINNSGYGIANRGVESQSQIKSINRLIEEAAKTKGEKLFRAIEKANEFWLKNFLVNADVYIAKASWLTYYEQELKRLGFDTSGIDYKTHKLNEEAANYAQRKVDRQQNVSDSDLAGKIFASKDAKTQAFVKGLMPFASFRMNQSARLGADLATLTNKTSTQEDKKIAATSLAGYAVEAATFRLIGIGIATILGGAVVKAMGGDEDDEEKKKRVDAIIKGARTGTITDVFSPLPLADKFVQMGASVFLNKIEKETELPISIYGATKQDVVQNAGLFGIAAERLIQTVELANLATTGTYTDNFGKEKKISEDKKDALGMFIIPSLLSNIGLVPTEVNTAVRYAIKEAKKKEGKSTEDKSSSEDRKSKIQEDKEQKLEALDNLKENARSQEELDAIEKKIDVLEATTEEKKAIKNERKEERELKKELLTDPDTGVEYDTEGELKRYNPKLYNKNFGPQSDWYKEHKEEKEVEKKLNKEIRKAEDKEFNYNSNRNSDGTIKKKRFGFKND